MFGPRKAKRYQLVIRLTEGEKALLDRLAQEQRLTLSDTVRRILKIGLERDGLLTGKQGMGG